MSKKSGNRLIAKLKVAPSLATAFSVLHLGALALLFPIDAPPWLRLSLAVALLVSFYRTMKHHIFRSAATSITTLCWDAEEGLSVQLRSDEMPRSAAIRGRFVHRWLVLLSVQLADSRFPTALAIPADAIDRDTFRRLRAALLAPRRMQVE